jgi:hypothetical protein
MQNNVRGDFPPSLVYSLVGPRIPLGLRFVGKGKGSWLVISVSHPLHDRDAAQDSELMKWPLSSSHHPDQVRLLDMLPRKFMVVVPDESVVTK